MIWLHIGVYADFDIGEIAVEAFTCLMIFKNMFSFGLTWGAYDWLVKAGSLKTFYVIASIQIGVCLLSIPMCKSNPSILLLQRVILKGIFCRHLGEEEQSVLPPARPTEDDASMVGRQRRWPFVLRSLFDRELLWTVEYKSRQSGLASVFRVLVSH